jgi:hypothetical protein
MKILHLQQHISSSTHSLHKSCLSDQLPHASTTNVPALSQLVDATCSNHFKMPYKKIDIEMLLL